jgi:hypothetical protein
MKFFEKPVFFKNFVKNFEKIEGDPEDPEKWPLMDS